MTLSPARIALVLIGGFLATNAAIILSHIAEPWPFNMVSFCGLLFLPGLALLRILKTTHQDWWAGALYSFGLSILVLMLAGLAINVVLPLFGFNNPLTLSGILGVWNGMVGGLIGVAIYTNRQPVQFKKWVINRLHIGIVAASAILPIGAVFGAWQVNNGGEPVVAVATLAYAALLITAIFLWRRRLPNGVMAWFIFCLGLGVLLMTSMRGWDIVGHDIQREFRVFTLAAQHERWDIALDRDPYNACLSITILPVMLSALLNISGVLIFKLVFQIMFAACGVVVFILLRRHAPRLAALVGSLLFICYPTFINDSAMLTRQGIAYLFFALAILVLSKTTQQWRHRTLFLLLSAGAILSHYSTAYMFVALFGVAVVCKIFFRWWHNRKHSGQRPKPTPTVLSPLFAALLFLMTFVWYAQITETSGGLSSTVYKAVTNIPSLFTGDDNRSSDTSTALFFANAKSQVDLYESYLQNSGQGNVPQAARDPQFMPTLTDDILPVTSLGKQLESLGVNLSVVNTLRQSFARILQVLAIAGVAFVAYRLIRRHSHTLPLDFICLSLAGLSIIALIVVMPVLSVNYGVLRAFQQVLIFLLLPITMLLVFATKSLKPRLRTGLATGGIVFLFLLFTGVIAQALGGSSPSLSLNNKGLYYGLYYSDAADQRTFTWLKNNVTGHSNVRAANFNRAFMHEPAYPFSSAGILPLQTGPQHFVYADHAQKIAQRLYVYYESSPLILTFPISYYDITKDLLFSTSTTGVYK